MTTGPTADTAADPLADPGAALLVRLEAVQSALSHGRWDEAQNGAAALHADALEARKPAIAADAASVASRSLFNLDRLEQAEAWCSRTVEAAGLAADAGRAAAGWVVMAATRARLERTADAIDSVHRAMALLDNELPAPMRRTVYFGVAITYRALGLWSHAVGGWRAAVDADMAAAKPTQALIVSRINFVESALRAYDDIAAVDADAAARLLRDFDSLAADAAAAESTQPQGWHRFLGRHVIGGWQRRRGNFAAAISVLKGATEEEAGHPAAARGAVWLELAEAQRAAGDSEAARASAAQAAALLEGERVGATAARPVPALHDLWRARRLLGEDTAALALLVEYQQRHARNVLALLDAQVAGLTRRLSEQTLRLQNADLREANEGLARNIEHISRQAHTDALTGLLNRRALATAFAALQAEARPLVIVMIDVDHFKAVNDRHSHAVGDAVLRRIGLLLADGLRAPDRLGRWGGEEFTALLSGVDPAAAWHVVERLRLRVAGFDWAPHVSAQGLALTISAGLVSVQPRETLEQAAARADAWLYKAKNAGRNCVLFQ